MGNWIEMRDVWREFVLREMSGDSLRKFASAVGIQRTDLTNMRNGVRDATLGMVEKVAQAKGMTLSDAMFKIARIAVEFESGRLPTRQPPARKVAMTEEFGEALANDAAPAGEISEERRPDEDDEPAPRPTRR